MLVKLMIIPNQENSFDIIIQDYILTKVSTVKFLGVSLDENHTFIDQANKLTTKITKSVGVMRILHCQLPADVMAKIYYSLVYFHNYYFYRHGEDREVLMLLRWSVLMGELANNSQIITKRSSPFYQFMITFRY